MKPITLIYASANTINWMWNHLDSHVQLPIKQNKQFYLTILFLPHALWSAINFIGKEIIIAIHSSLHSLRPYLTHYIRGQDSVEDLNSHVILIATLSQGLMNEEKCSLIHWLWAFVQVSSLHTNGGNRLGNPILWGCHSCRKYDRYYDYTDKLNKS